MPMNDLNTRARPGAARHLLGATLSATLVFYTNAGFAQSGDLPEAVRHMLDAAMASGAEETVAWVAAQAYPEHVSAIFAYAKVDPSAGYALDPVPSDEAQSAPGHAHAENMTPPRPDVAESLGETEDQVGHAGEAVDEAGAAEPEPEERSEQGSEHEEGASGDGKSEADRKTPKILSLEAWTGEFEAGGGFTTGNAQTSDTSIALNATLERRLWSMTFKGSYAFGRDDGETSKQRTEAGLNVDVNLTEHGYLSGRIDYEDDVFSGFDYRLFGGLGLGWRLYTRDAFKWSIEAGPGVRYSVLEEPRDGSAVFSARASSSLEWLINERVTLAQTAGALWSTETITTQSVSSLSTEINSHLTARFSYDVRYETEPPADNVKLDTVARASFVLDF